MTNCCDCQKEQDYNICDGCAAKRKFNNPGYRWIRIPKGVRR